MLGRRLIKGCTPPSLSRHHSPCCVLHFNLVVYLLGLESASFLVHVLGFSPESSHTLLFLRINRFSCLTSYSRTRVWWLRKMRVGCRGLRLKGRSLD